MSEYEWETRRVPRPARAPLPWGYRPRASEVAEFLSLEHPGESVAWVLRHHASTPAGQPAGKRARVASPVVPAQTAHPEPQE